MKEFAKFFHFVDGRRILYRLTSKNPEKMPQYVKGFIKHNETYEQESKFIQSEIKTSFINSGCFYFALSQLYKFGASPYFPDISVKSDTSRTAYWLLKAFAYHDNEAFVFLHSLVPECFIKDHSTIERLQAIENVLLALKYLSMENVSIKERCQNQLVACFIADLMNLPKINLKEAVGQLYAAFIKTDKELEPLQVVPEKS